ncbi:membrane protein of ER body-like protein isoform X3 [Primulina huaijiensis]|uniref:membrane protein of ER body-like protein isoform X3 n=1 Tax=Primulina huaijiensis TaxID=1492673 RepID=UPI003CC704B6
MEKEEQKWEQEEVEEEQEEEEASLQVRKSRPVNETGSTESAIVETENNNGTSESNGHGTKDFESTLENGEGKDELDVVVGNEEEVSNELQKSDNLVFFEEDEGNEITPQNSGDQQIEKSNGHNELDILSQEFDALHNSTSTVNGGSGGHLNDDNLSYSDHQQNGIREGDGLSNSYLKSSGEIECEEVYVVPGDELEVTEIDVEQVLQKQTTHDLYCPNCNSCITRRVILRKRKRGIRLSAQDIKRNKLEAVADSKLDADSFQVSSTVVHETDYIGDDSTPLIATNVTDHDREPDLFRCMSCFSFFFPTGNGFKLFRIFEGKKVKVNIKDEQVSSTKKNWFASMLTFNKPETAVARGSKSGEDVRKSDEGLVPSSNIIDHKVSVDAVSDKTDEKIGDMATPVYVLEDVDGRLDISLAVPQEDQDVEATIVTESVVENEKANFQSGDDGRVYPAKVSQHIVTKTKFEVHAGESLKIDGIPSVNGVSIVQGKDTVITIDARPVGSSQTGQNIVYPEETNSALHSAPQVTVADADGTEVRNESEIEVIKSIVYGGLAESITSLGVVSSAAGGGAATLKIVALGIASLIGGFFVICQNLWELRSECTEQALNHVSPVIERRDRYKELLGQKENFVIHAIVSILSYIIFGLVAPVAYGFSFRKSDNKEFKLILVAAASLLCICGLAVGRAYVRRPPRPYLKSVVTYVLLGFMVSGLSYVAGVLVERILEKLGLFHSSSGDNLLLRQMETVPSYSGYWTSH